MGKLKQGVVAQAAKRRQRQRVQRETEGEDVANKQSAGPAPANRSGVALRTGALRCSTDAVRIGSGSLPELPFDAALLYRAGTVECQAAVLQRLNVAHRRTALRHISRVQGNWHVQRVVAAHYAGRTSPQSLRELSQSEDRDGKVRAFSLGAVQAKPTGGGSLQIGQPGNVYKQKTDQVALMWPAIQRQALALRQVAAEEEKDKLLQPKPIPEQIFSPITRISHVPGSGRISRRQRRRTYRRRRRTYRRRRRTYGRRGGCLVRFPTRGRWLKAILNRSGQKIVYMKGNRSIRSYRTSAGRNTFRLLGRCHCKRYRLRSKQRMTSTGLQYFATIARGMGTHSDRKRTSKTLRSMCKQYRRYGIYRGYCKFNNFLKINKLDPRSLGGRAKRKWRLAWRKWLRTRIKVFTKLPITGGFASGGCFRLQHLDAKAVYNLTPISLVICRPRIRRSRRRTRRSRRRTRRSRRR